MWNWESHLSKIVGLFIVLSSCNKGISKFFILLSVARNRTSMSLSKNFSLCKGTHQATREALSVPVLAPIYILYLQILFDARPSRGMLWLGLLGNPI